jgi:ankyrin repeat protein
MGKKKVQSSKNLQSQLEQAVRSSDLERVRELLAAGVELNPGPMQDAATAGKLELIKVLLDSGVDPNQEDLGSKRLKGLFSRTGLSNAVSNGHEEVAVEFLRRGADPWLDRPMIGGPVLHQAVVKGFTQVVQAIVASKADLDRRGDIAIAERPPATVEKQHDAKDRVTATKYVVHEAPSARQATALIVAVRCGKKEIVEILAGGGADLEAPDGDGFTPLAWALKLGHDDIARLLRRAGAKDTARTEGAPQFALITAAGDGDAAGVRKALADGADPSALYEVGRDTVSALMRAAEAGHVKIVEQLLNHGADPNSFGMPMW